MTAMSWLDAAPTRRGVIGGAGSLVLAFSLASRDAHAEEAGGAPAVPGTAKPVVPALPGSLKEAPFLDSWIHLDAQGALTILSGKAELGQGIKTALIQVAAEELRVATDAIRLVTADTALTANEGYTAGSHSMQDSATAIRHAAAQVREILIGLAAARLEVPASQLTAAEGAIAAPDARQVAYGDLVAGADLHVTAAPQSPLTAPGDHRVIGRSLPRIDIPAKVTGGAAYVQDMRLPGMLHARVVRPPAYGAKLSGVDTAEIERMPGVVKVVRDGSYLAVVAEREYQAIEAMRALAAAARWTPGSGLPDEADILGVIGRLPADQHVIHDVQAPAAAPTRAVEARYSRRYQLHGSIGPSCALALMDDGKLTVWSHGQGMFPLRTSLAQLLQMPPESVHCIHVEGSGCYGHNGADDAAADAALIARAVPGKPIRLQWMRADEHLWEPYGPAMLTRARASLDATGGIVGWDYEVRSNTHATRPPGAGNLMPSWHLAEPLAPPPPKPLPLPEGGGDRNAIPLYRLPNARVVHQFVPAMPLRVSAMRGLGAYMNVFSIESFMDELAAAAGSDPVAFRLRHMADERARDVIAKAAELFGWSGRVKASGRGFGFAFARYKNLGAYAAIALEVAVAHETGAARVVRAVAAVDSGEAVNPNGIANQIEGGIVQSASWTLYEAVTFDRERITSRDWSTYPILRFPAVPDRIDVHVMERPGEPFLGTGEAAQGPAAAAIANAIADATGCRMREIPITRARLKAAIGV